MKLKGIFTTLLCIALSFSAHAQLKNSIGIGSLPKDSESICTIPTYKGSFDQSGLKQGDTAFDFTLYGTDDVAFTLSTALSSGKPVLLIGGNYTCPVFRNKFDVINDVQKVYGDRVQIYVVYGVEAHPLTDVSPYSGTVWTSGTNETEGVLFRQATNYGERKTTAKTMLSEMNLTVPVLLDGPCNEWWSTYGPAPNNAYFIGTNGVVMAKHGWFHRAPNDIYCDLETWLGNSCTAQGTDGTFTWQLSGSNSASGVGGSIIHLYGNLINNTDQSVEVEIMRIQNNVPSNWSSAMCTDICLPSGVDSTGLVIAARDTQPYIMYFYTGSGSDSGHVRMGFRNVKDPSNKFVQDFYADTHVLGLDETNSLKVRIFPNPSNDVINITGLDGKAKFSITDGIGKLHLSGINSGEEIRIDMLASGIYFLRVEYEGKSVNKRILIQH